MNEFQEKLKNKMDRYAHLAYKLSNRFPKSELYGMTSQFRRASLSIILNYIEGFARKKRKVKKNLWEISYGSLRESKYLLKFAYEEGYLEKENFKKANELAEEIGAMLWHSIQSLTNN